MRLDPRLASLPLLALGLTLACNAGEGRDTDDPTGLSNASTTTTTMGTTTSPGTTSTSTDATSTTDDTIDPMTGPDCMAPCPFHINGCLGQTEYVECMVDCLIKQAQCAEGDLCNPDPNVSGCYPPINPACDDIADAYLMALDDNYCLTKSDCQWAAGACSVPYVGACWHAASTNLAPVLMNTAGEWSSNECGAWDCDAGCPDEPPGDYDCIGNVCTKI